MSNAAVKIIVGQNHIAVMDPPVLAILPLLQYKERRYVPGGPTGYRSVDEVIPLGHLDFRDRVGFSAGLLPRVQRELQELGHHVQVEDLRRIGDRMEIDDEVFDDLDPKDRTLISDIAPHFQGQVQVRMPKDAYGHCVTIARIFPRAKIVIAVATYEAVGDIWERLTTALEHERIGLEMSGVSQSGDRIVVTTYKCAKAGARRLPVEDYEEDDAETLDILLLPHGEQATGKVPKDMVAGLKPRKGYAFIQAGRRQDRHVELALEAMAGPIVHRIGKPHVGVRVVMVPAPGMTVVTSTTTTVETSTTALEQKRSFYWCNEARNRLIADIATAVWHGRYDKLRQYGFSDRDMQRININGSMRVVIVVESPEHARNLLKLLPTWGMFDKVPLERRQPRVLATTENDVPITRRVIVTQQYTGKQRTRADIVIRATGTPWGLRVKGFPAVAHIQDKRPALWIDFADTFDKDAHRDAHRRAEEYRRRGYTVSTPQREE
jgi:hypothetical protein